MSIFLKYTSHYFVFELLNAIYLSLETQNLPKKN